jgi:hypothetical protein
MSISDAGAINGSRRRALSEDVPGGSLSPLTHHSSAFGGYLDDETHAGAKAIAGGQRFGN